MNPHETLHTPNETLQWFDDNNVEFLNLIPHYDISKNNLFQKKERPKISYLNNFLMCLNKTQILEGGFFYFSRSKKIKH